MPQKIFTAAQRKTAFVWAIIGAVCFSFKAICAKLLYREGGVDAVDVIALRMLFSLPFFIWHFSSFLMFIFICVF